MKEISSVCLTDIEVKQDNQSLVPDETSIIKNFLKAAAQLQLSCLRVMLASG